MLADPGVGLQLQQDMAPLNLDRLKIMDKKLEREAYPPLSAALPSAHLAGYTPAFYRYHLD
jgi:hypothetical protein